MAKIFRYFLIGIFFVGGLAWGALKAPEFVAPGGAECDLKQGIIKYYANGSQLIEANWEQMNFRAKYLEYYKNSEILNAKQQVKITETMNTIKTLSCDELNYQHKNAVITAKQKVSLQANDLLISGQLLIWERKNNLARLSGAPKLVYQDWEIIGSKFEAKLDQELFNIFGPVSGKNQELIFQADQVLFDRKQQKIYLEGNVVIVRQEREELTANKVIYDLKTKKFRAVGPVKSRIIETQN